ncbi:MAG: cytochrome-c oxidase, cbb3-type subunit II, partial [Bacteroidia bacterium]
MFAVGITAYGMATFEGPMLSLKNVNAIAHFTDWIVAHVHVGALGWNGLLTFAIIYWMIPRMYRTHIYSKKLINVHFWLATLGIVFYAVPMYWSGFTQGLMWKEFTADGMLQYPEFLKTTLQIIPLHVVRSLGGTLYLAGFFVMIYNVVKTMKAGSFLANEPAEAPALDKTTLFKKGDFWHAVLEKKPVTFTVLAVVAILIGGAVEMLPTFLIKENIPTISSVKPYTPLELEGRDLYIREGCNACHTQWVRPFRSETERYMGEYSKAGEYVYDHPFLWGSKRTGPDLHRVGGKYPNSWHYIHMNNPVNTSPGSIMPAYPWLAENDLDIEKTADKLRAMQTLGVPYSNEEIQNGVENLKKQAQSITENLAKDGIALEPNKELVAMIAYLQRLGMDIKNQNLKTAQK